MPYKNIADFRSDTVTRPTKAMYDALCRAELGDDAFSDDPAVIGLEEKCAELAGKEKALFFPSGTMANQTAVRVLCDPGKEVIVEEDSHIINYEKGSLAYAMVQVRTLRGIQGAIPPEELARKIKKGNSHRPATGLVCLENPHNLSGGTIVDQQCIIELCDIAHRHKVPVYLDGARLFNAQVATGIPVKELAAPADALMFCLSKSLGAPAGSVLCGDLSFIQQARTVRQYLGGTLHQAGILAACGLEALQPANISRLAEDHHRTKILARELSGLPFLSLPHPEVNIHIFYLAVDEKAPFDARQLVAAAKVENILLLAPGIRMIRIMCHKDIDDRDTEHLVSFLKNHIAQYESIRK